MKSILLAMIALGCVTSGAWSGPSAASRPNVILILADDLGWSDCGLQGANSFHPTPNLCRLAARGMTFSRAYSNSPLCSPTRASILTGQSPARHGITAPVGHLPTAKLRPSLPTAASVETRLLAPDSATRLDTHPFTLAEAFALNGYATGHFGKWHLGTPPHSPLEHGFQVDVPHDNGPGPRKGFVGVWDYPDLHPRTPEDHLEERMTEEAIRFIETHKDKPFFLNYWQFSVHAPFGARKELIEKHRAACEGAKPRRSATYAAMVETMDAAVGRLLDCIDRNGLAEKTIILFISDNGGNMYDRLDGTTPTQNAPLRGGKATIWEGGIRAPCVIAWPGVVAPGSRSAELIQTSDFYPTFAAMPGFSLQGTPTFDGRDIHPALHGGRMDREAVFVYFPHNPKVPDTLPPAVAAISEDWKLIRIFHDGPQHGHRHLLYHLKEDIGETKDLAAQHPEIVRRMDALIDQHLAATGAVVPKPNPSYVPGSSRSKFGHSKSCSFKIDGGLLHLRSTGTDPWFSASLRHSESKGPFLLRFRMKSGGGGPGKILWQEAPGQAYDGKSRAVGFSPVHDSEFHEIEVRLPCTTLAGIRIDPGEAAGDYQFDHIAVMAGERTVFSWPPPIAKK